MTRKIAELYSNLAYILASHFCTRTREIQRTACASRPQDVKSAEYCESLF